MVKLSVLMPVYNEARTLRTIVSRVLESPVEHDIERDARDTARPGFVPVDWNGNEVHWFRAEK